MDLASCLPADLRDPSTRITRIAAGLSGAGVYRVEAGERVFVLKVAADTEPVVAWRRRREIQESAAGAGLAPQVVHADEERRAIVSAFVVDRSFPALFGNPATREDAVRRLGQMLRKVHELPLPADVEVKDPRAFLANTWSDLAAAPLPAFVGDAVRRVLSEEPPPRERAPVLSHNDVNPTNLTFDGENLLLLDWDTAGANDPLYDLASIAVFLRMDDDTCRALLAAHDDAPVPVLPARFGWLRRLAAVMCGTVFLRLARHPAHAELTLEATPTLLEFYQRMRAGTLSVATAEGQSTFGLALVKASLAASDSR